MFVKVNSPQAGQNSGSCGDLAEYLDKDEETKFFSLEKDSVEKNELIDEIDKNGTGGLKKHEDKFYMLTINPSQRELNHLLGRPVNHFADLTQDEKLKLESYLKSYTHDVMSIYAKNFNRENIENNKDLVYFARIETERRYRHYDKEVLTGSKRCGDLKGGLNYHVHVIVSRKGKNNKTLLSPNVKSRGNNWELNGKQAQRGFNHEAFKQKASEHFNAKYHYKPSYNDTYKTKSNTQVSSIKNASNALLNKSLHNVKKEFSITKDQLITEKKVLHAATKVVRAVKNPVGAAKTELLNIIKGISKSMDRGL